MVVLPLRGHMNLRAAFAMEFHGIADEILKQLGQLGGVRHHGRQRVAGDLGVGFMQRDGEIGEGEIERGVAVGGFEGFATGADAG